MIREAVLDDIPAIYSLYQSFSLDVSRVEDNKYAEGVQRNGFVVALENKEDLEERLKTNSLFNVYEEDGNILGFIICNKEIYFPEEAENIVWFDEKLKDNYFHVNTSIALHEIIVDHNHQRKSIASRLLEDALTTLRTKEFTDLYSIVTQGPVTNCPSIVFHTKNDFRRACVTNPIDLFGLKNYQSLLFHKEI